MTARDARLVGSVNATTTSAPRLSKQQRQTGPADLGGEPSPALVIAQRPAHLELVAPFDDGDRRAAAPDELARRSLVRDPLVDSTIPPVRLRLAGTCLGSLAATTHRTIP